MNKELKQVTEFHWIGNHPVGDSDNVNTLDMDRLLSRANWMQEEINELKEATQKKDILGSLDALGDLAYFLFGTVIEMGGQHVFEEVFARIHAANMTKFAPTYAEGERTIEAYVKEGITTYQRTQVFGGKTYQVIYFADGPKAGKIAKYVDWQEPNFEGILPDVKPA